MWNFNSYWKLLRKYSIEAEKSLVLSSVALLVIGTWQPDRNSTANLKWSVYRAEFWYQVMLLCAVKGVKEQTCPPDQLSSFRKGFFIGKWTRTWTHRLLSSSTEFLNFKLKYRLLLFQQIDKSHHDQRLHHPRHHSEITKYMDAAWRVKEQSENMN